MPRMVDTARREKLAARAEDLRAKAESLMSQCKDGGAKAFVKSHVLNWVDDVEGFFLRHKTDDTAGFEGTWLLGAEHVMLMAEKGYASLVEQFNKFGGPGKVQVIGG